MSRRVLRCLPLLLLLVCTMALPIPKPQIKPTVTTPSAETPSVTPTQGTAAPLGKPSPALMQSPNPSLETETLPEEPLEPLEVRGVIPRPQQASPSAPAYPTWPQTRNASEAGYVGVSLGFEPTVRPYISQVGTLTQKLTAADVGRLRMEGNPSGGQGASSKGNGNGYPALWRVSPSFMQRGSIQQEFSTGDVGQLIFTQPPATTARKVDP